jgi:hypothetical protein
MGSIPNYQGAANWANLETMVGSEGQTYIKIYNNSTVLTNGDIKVLSYYVDATDTSNPIIYPIPVAASTNAANNVVMVIDNSPKDLGTIAANAWGWAVIKGYVSAFCFGTTSIAVGDQLEVLNGSPTYFTRKTQASSGASPILGLYAAAIAMEAYAVGTRALKKVCLTGIMPDIE